MSETNSLNPLELTTFEPQLADAEATPAADAAGHQLFECIGVGGMGEVYRCGDDALQRDLALKVLKAELRGDGGAERRFLREARLTGSLQHPGIVPVHHLGRLADGRPCYSMKLVRGRTLSDLLREEPAGAERLPRLLAVVEKVCQAMAFAHSKGVIHRDLKPSNVMVGEFGEVQVMDWGLAKELREQETAAVPDEAPAADETVARAEEAAGLSRAGAALGTPAYMPPEQAAGDWDIVDERADVFALGAVLCEALTVRPPYQGATRDDVLRRARRGDLAEALGRLARCGADAALTALCRECLAAEREGRPRNADVVAKRLAAYQAEVQERLRRAEVERAAAEVRAREERKRRRLTLALAAVLLLLVTGVGGALWWWQRQQEKADGVVSNGLAQAELLAAQARADPVRADKYHQALEAARVAAQLADSASADARRRAEELVARLEREEEAARKDRELLAALLDVRGPREGPQYTRDATGTTMVALAEATADEQFTAAFRRWGLDVDGTDPARAAALLKARPPLVVTEVVAALDDWASERRQGEPKAEWRRLADLAAVLDDDPGSKRRELRELMARGRLPVERALGVLSAWLRPVPLPVEVPLGTDRARLRRLAEQTEPAREPVLGLLTLARALRVAGDEALAEQLLRAAIVARPREVVLYHTLGQLLSEQEPPRWAEAVECYGAARVARPDLGVKLATALLNSGRDREGLALLAQLVRETPSNPYLHFQQAYAFCAQGRLDESLVEYRHALALDPKLAKAHANLGVVLHDKGQLDEAIAEHRQALALDPKLAQTHNNLGVALHDKGRWDEAIAEYRQALALDSKLAQTHTNLGVVLAAKGHLDEAMAEHRQAIALDPKLATAHLNLGVALRAKGQLEEALAAYRQAIALDPKYAKAHNNLGTVLADKGLWDEALAAYRQALALDPRLTKTHANLGFVLAEKGRWDEAMAACRQALALDPKNGPVHYNLGFVLRKKGQWDEAMAEFRQAIALDPKDVLAHHNLGIVLADKGRWDEAIAEYRQALALDPRHVLAHHNLGLALRDKGLLEEAMTEFREAIALDPKLAKAHHNLGVVLADQRRWEEALAAYRQALALNPKLAKTHNNLGFVLAEKGQLDAAMAEYRQAIALDPKHAPAHYNLGRALVTKGRGNEAIAEYRKVIALDPKHVLVHHSLGVVLAAKGQLDEAMTEFRQALALDPKLATAHGALGLALREQGRYAAAREATRRALELLPTDAPLRRMVLQQLQQCDRLLTLDQKLPAILTGETTPANPGEAITLAQMCQQPYKKRYAASARLYADAFAAEPKLAADLNAGHRYNAARSALLAASGHGEDARLLPDKVVLMFRRWALGWLRDDLTAYAKLAANPGAKPMIRQRLLHWQSDADLASVRDRAPLDRLPEAERAAWQALWRDVDELLTRLTKSGGLVE